MSMKLMRYCTAGNSGRDPISKHPKAVGAFGLFLLAVDMGKLVVAQNGCCSKSIEVAKELQ
mgnify:CR=1 FL=1